MSLRAGSTVLFLKSLRSTEVRQSLVYGELIEVYEVRRACCVMILIGGEKLYSWWSHDRVSFMATSERNGQSATIGKQLRSVNDNSNPIETVSWNHLA